MHRANAAKLAVTEVVVPATVVALVIPMLATEGAFEPPPQPATRPPSPATSRRVLRVTLASKAELSKTALKAL
jgi:hypothetical protein